MEDDYYEDEIAEANFDIARWHELSIWLIRAVISIPLLAALALILKYYLIEPYSISVLEFEFESVPMKKGDRENILNYEMRWNAIKNGEESI